MAQKGVPNQRKKGYQMRKKGYQKTRYPLPRLALRRPKRLI